MGQTAYFGPAIDSLEHFALLGHRPDGLVNPADYLLEVYRGRPHINAVCRISIPDRYSLSLHVKRV